MRSRPQARTMEMASAPAAAAAAPLQAPVALVRGMWPQTGRRRASRARLPALLAAAKAAWM